jgi:hypothetical protein
MRSILEWLLIVPLTYLASCGLRFGACGWLPSYLHIIRSCNHKNQYPKPKSWLVHERVMHEHEHEHEDDMTYKACVVMVTFL